MTNAEKYLKEEQFIFDISKGIAEAICYDDMEHSKKITEKEIRHWFTNNIEPTLTEDERVILRNIKLYVGRRMNGELFFAFENREEPYIKGELFQFIKERRRI